MKQLCNKCQSYKKDVTDYHFTSTKEHHTFISLALCIECRDKVIEVFTTNETMTKCRECGDCYED